MLGCIAGGCLDASTFILLDALLVKQPAQKLRLNLKGHWKTLTRIGVQKSRGKN